MESVWRGNSNALMDSKMTSMHRYLALAIRAIRDKDEDTFKRAIDQGRSQVFNELSQLTTRMESLPRVPELLTKIQVFNEVEEAWKQRPPEAFSKLVSKWNASGVASSMNFYESELVLSVRQSLIHNIQPSSLQQHFANVSGTCEDKLVFVYILNICELMQSINTFKGLARSRGWPEFAANVLHKFKKGGVLQEMEFIDQVGMYLEDSRVSWELGNLDTALNTIKQVIRAVSLEGSEQTDTRVKSLLSFAKLLTAQWLSVKDGFASSIEDAFGGAIQAAKEVQTERPNEAQSRTLLGSCELLLAQYLDAQLKKVLQRIESPEWKLEVEIQEASADVVKGLEDSKQHTKNKEKIDVLIEKHSKVIENDKAEKEVSVYGGISVRICDSLVGIYSKDGTIVCICISMIFLSLCCLNLTPHLGRLNEQEGIRGFHPGTLLECP